MVLVVEDEMTQRLILTRHLEKADYQVFAAENGEEGLAIWRENPKIRVVITDLLMPKLDGFGVVGQIRKDEAHYTYIIVLTALSERDGLVRALSLVADDYVTKPIFEEEILLRLQGAARLLRLEGHDIAMCHHEKWDGRGYPHGLSGEGIPLAAKIMAMADVFDALTSSRCYKDVYSFDRARSIIIKERAHHFDPMLVEAYLRVESEMMVVQQKFQEQPQE